MFDPSVKLPAGLETSAVGQVTARAFGLRGTLAPAGRPARTAGRKPSQHEV